MKGYCPNFKIILFVIFSFGLFGLAESSWAAEEIYISQMSAGGNSGTDCANSHSAAWFNTTSNWGSETGKIGAGGTVHLCGIFAAPNINATPMLTVQNSGSSGSPITVLFEAGAIIQAPYWGSTGAINLNGKSYITLDGGTVCGKVDGPTSPTTVCNGTIRNTLAGSTGQTCP